MIGFDMNQVSRVVNSYLRQEEGKLIEYLTPHVERLLTLVFCIQWLIMMENVKYTELVLTKYLPML
jgi:hypothetical protein